MSARLWLSAVLSVLALIAFNTALVVDLHFVKSAEAERTAARETQASARGILSSLKDVETGERGYLLTGRPRYLEPYDAGGSQLRVQQTMLHTLTQNSDPALRQEVTLLDDVVSRKVADTSRMIAARRQNRPLDLTALDRGKTDMDEARLIVATIAAQARTSLEEMTRDIDTLRNQLVSLTIVGAAIVALIVLSATWFSTRAIKMRLKRLFVAFERIGKGESLPDLGDMGHGEIARVGHAFTDMARRLTAEGAQRASAEHNLTISNQTLTTKTLQLEVYSTTVNIVRRMADRLPGCADETEFSSVIESFAPELMPRRPGVLYLLNNSHNLLTASAAWNGQHSSVDQFTPSDCWGLRRGQPHESGWGQVEIPCAHIKRSDAQMTHWCIPLVAQSETVGLLYVENPDHDLAVRPDADDVVRMLGETVALALVNLRLREKLRSQSVRDALTGLYNRRYLDESIELEFARSARSNTAVSIVMLDIDHFKNFNDTFGHEAGDVVLKQVADVFVKATRKGDIAGRFGGEEFLLIMPGADTRQAVDRSEMLREAIRGLDLVHAGHKLGMVTASFGVATYLGSDQTSLEVIEEADKALYAAKATGRDRVVAADYARADSR